MFLVYSFLSVWSCELFQEFQTNPRREKIYQHHVLYYDVKPQDEDLAMFKKAEMCCLFW